jgi:hypothetical protein
MRIGPFTMLHLEQGNKIEVSLTGGQWHVQLRDQDKVYAEARAGLDQKAGVSKAMRKIERALAKAGIASVLETLRANRQKQG